MVIYLTSSLSNIQTCSGAFPGCGLQKNTVYKCTALGATKASLTAAKDNADQLALIAGQISKTANGTAVMFQRIRSTFSPEKQNVLVPAVQKLVKLLSLLGIVIQCSGSNGSDCSGIIRLYHDFVDASITHMHMLAVPPRDVTMPKLIAQVQNVTRDIDGVFVSKNETVLKDIGKQLNTIITETSFNTKDYGDSSDVLELIYQSASKALKCHGEYLTLASKLPLMSLQYVH